MASIDVLVVVLQSVSAFAPISNPVNCAWGKKAFGNYLGPDESKWKVRLVAIISPELPSCRVYLAAANVLNF
jgi:hypothetical protein